MGKTSLKEKLSAHVSSFENGGIQEKDIIYLFIEMGKYLEHDKDVASFPTINFFRNWIAHPRKEKVHSIPEALRIAIETSSNYGEIAEVFILTVSNLRRDLIAFCNATGINAILEQDGVWQAFSQKLFGVLAEQPICFDQKLNRTLEIDGIEGGYSLIVQDSNGGYQVPLAQG